MEAFVSREAVLATLRERGLSTLAARLERAATIPAHVSAAIALLARAEAIAAAQPETVEVAAQISQIVYRLQDGG